jgi:hypothetical protein
LSNGRKKLQQYSMEKYNMNIKNEEIEDKEIERPTRYNSNHHKD